MYFSDYVSIVLKSIVLSLLCLPIIIGITYLIEFNFNVANYISNLSGIPSDMSISMMSLGFANNIVVLLSAIEFGLCVYFCDKVANTSIYKNVKTFIANL